MMFSSIVYSTSGVNGGGVPVDDIGDGGSSLLLFLEEDVVERLDVLMVGV